MVTTPRKKTISRGLMLLICAVSVGVLLNSCKPDNAPKEDGVWIPMPKDTSSLGKLNHYIPITDLDKFRGRFRRDRDSLARKVPDLGFTRSEAFNKRALVEVLKDPRCVGIRIYYGVKEKGKKGEFRVMIVGVDEQGKDLYIKKGSLMATGGDDPDDGGLEYGQCEPPCDNTPPDSTSGL